MAGLEVNASSSKCRKCGLAYGKLKGAFPVCYGYLYRGVGYLPYCKDCMEKMYEDYYAICQDQKASMRQICRKLDLYWSDKLYGTVESQNTVRTIMSNYIQKINNTKYAGKSYDDTLKEEGMLWSWPNSRGADTMSVLIRDNNNSVGGKEDDAEPPSDDVIAYWGPGYAPSMYHELEQRLQYWKSKLPDIDMDMGTEALLRQITMAEIDINRARAEGKPTDKMVSSLNTLLGSAMLKPAQKKDDIDTPTLNTPFGVWIKRWEDERPTPEIDPELKDVDGIVRYIQIWFLGHLCKMLGIKNTYSRLYDEEIARLRVERPEYDDEDDESMIYDIFGDESNDEQE